MSRVCRLTRLTVISWVVAAVIVPAANVSGVRAEWSHDLGDGASINSPTGIADVVGPHVASITTTTLMVRHRAASDRNEGCTGGAEDSPEIPFGAGEYLTGCVTDRAGRPIARELLSVHARGGDRDDIGVMYPKPGRYADFGLYVGDRYEVTADAPGYAPVTKSVTLGPDTPTVLDFVLERDRGRDAPGREVPGGLPRTGGGAAGQCRGERGD